MKIMPCQHCGKRDPLVAAVEAESKRVKAHEEAE